MPYATNAAGSTRGGTNRISVTKPTMSDASRTRNNKSSHSSASGKGKMPQIVADDSSTRTTRSKTSSNTDVKAPNPGGTTKEKGGRGGGKGMRMISSHIFFWGGVLSNRNLGVPFSGYRCVELLIPRLEELGVSHPALKAFSTRLLTSYDFVCGEQWMMAVKGWLFERTGAEFLFGETQFDDNIGKEDEEREFRRLRALMLSPSSSSISFLETPILPPPSTVSSTDLKSDTAAAAAAASKYSTASTIVQCLRTTSPREHKALGRRAQNYSEEIWAKASSAVVISACIARAEADPELMQVYVKAAAAGDERKFVEGSPWDVIWGVGIRWDNARIEDPANWRGQNRLGVCHDVARKWVLGKWALMV